MQQCPTYLQTGLETESPRGRLYLMSALAEGTILPTETVAGHLDMCLQCRNCEAVCPSGVQFGRKMEHAREQVLISGQAPLSWHARSLFLRHVIARPAAMEAFAKVVRLSEQAGIRQLAGRLPIVGPVAVLAPRFGGRPFKRRGVIGRPEGAATTRVALLTGCMMPYAYGKVHRASVRVLTRNGCEVLAPKEQVCCGALHAHNGDLETARRLARRNIAAFEAAGADAVVVNSAGCGAAMKDYGDLLAPDPDYARRALALAGKVRDISEFLAGLPFEAPQGRLEAAATYQDSCHLAHAQGLTAAPRLLLSSIPGLRLVEMRTPGRCCGSAGVYALTQAEMSLRLLGDKMADVLETGAHYIATSNPGCMAQLEAGVAMARLRARVVHVVELLDHAYRG
jgi:glycolate oxidase iron-sulfur subunit